MGDPIRKPTFDSTINFEVSHPTLAGTVSSIIDALGHMGI